MIINFLRQSQTYNTAQRRIKRQHIQSRGMSYDNSFFTSLPFETSFEDAQRLIQAFIDDVLLRSAGTIEDADGVKWDSCNLQIAKDDISEKISFSVRLAAPTTKNAYAVEYIWLSGADEYVEEMPDNQEGYYMEVAEIELPPDDEEE